MMIKLDNVITGDKKLWTSHGVSGMFCGAFNTRGGKHTLNVAT